MKDKIINLLRKSGFKSIAVLSSGVFLAQIINFMVQPIATRLFDTADFGILTLITSLVSMFSALATMQYHMSIVNASTDEEADAVTKLSFWILGITSVLFTIGLIVYNQFFPESYADAGNLEPASLSSPEKAWRQGLREYTRYTNNLQWFCRV